MLFMAQEQKAKGVKMLFMVKEHKSERLSVWSSSDIHIQDMEVCCLRGNECIKFPESGEPGF